MPPLTNTHFQHRALPFIHSFLFLSSRMLRKADVRFIHQMRWDETYRTMLMIFDVALAWPCSSYWRTWSLQNDRRIDGWIDRHWRFRTIDVDECFGHFELILSFTFVHSEDIRVNLDRWEREPMWISSRLKANKQSNTFLFHSWKSLVRICLNLRRVEVRVRLYNHWFGCVW